MSTTKRCPSCGHTKDVDEGFYPEPRAYDGASAICRECLAATKRRKKREKREDTRGYYVTSPNGLRGTVLKVKDDDIVIHFKGSRTITLPLHKP